MLKDDTLGLGAKRNNGDECTGLDAFQSLLGRLNGKSDDTLEAERKAREDVKLSLYVERKLGTIRFVKGGWLVGDQVNDTPDEEVPKSRESPAPVAPGAPSDGDTLSEPAREKSKKRKAERDADREDDQTRKEKKSKKRKTDAAADAPNGDSGKKKKEKKSKQRRLESEDGTEQSAPSSKQKDKETVAEDTPQATSAVASESGEEQAEAGRSAAESKVKDKQNKKGKKEKGEKGEKKKKKKKDKKRDKTAPDSGTETGDSISGEKKRKKEESASGPVPEEAAKASTSTSAEISLSTPSGSGYSTPVPTGSSRYLARSRFIAQKKMAIADSAALNQVRSYIPFTGDDDFRVG